MLRFLQWLTRQDRLLRWLNPLFGRFNPFLPSHREDPHATWRALREEAPVYRSPVFRTVILTRYDDVLAVLRDANFTTDRRSVPLMETATRAAPVSRARSASRRAMICCSRSDLFMQRFRGS